MVRMPTATTAAIAEAFGLGRPEGPAVLADRGEQGRIWRLSTDRGRWAVKQSVGHPAEARASADIAFQEAAATHVPLPRPVRTRDGLALLDGALLPGSPADGAFRVFEWVDLDPQTPATAEDFGQIAAALHLLDHPSALEEEPWWGRGVELPQWEDLLDAGRAAGEAWVPDLEAALPDILGAAAWLTDDDPATLRTCHRDLSVLNVRRTRGGGLVVLDWENCGPAEPVRELAVLVVVYALQASVDRSVALYDAYLAAGGPARISTLADFSSAARGQQGLLWLYAGQTLDDTIAADVRAFARQRIARMLPPRVSRPEIADLLARLIR